MKITLIKSFCGCNKKQISISNALGLRKIGQTVEKEDVPSIRGMVSKICHLLSVEN